MSSYYISVRVNTNVILTNKQKQELKKMDNK